LLQFATFINKKAVDAYINVQLIRSFTSFGIQRYYRCNPVKRRGDQCPVSIYFLSVKTSTRVIIEAYNKINEDTPYGVTYTVDYSDGSYNIYISTTIASKCHTMNADATYKL